MRFIVVAYQSRWSLEMKFLYYFTYLILKHLPGIGSRSVY